MSLIDGFQPRYILDGKLRSTLSSIDIDTAVIISAKKKERPILFDEKKADLKAEPSILSKKHKETLDQYASLVDNMEKIREKYHSEYMNALGRQIEHDQNRMHTGTASHRTKPRYLQRDKIKFDNKEIPEEIFDEIIAVQDQFIKEGRIKTPSDMDNFWLDVHTREFREIYLKSWAAGQASNAHLSLLLKKENMDKHWAVVQAMRRTVKPSKSGTTIEETRLRSSSGLAGPQGNVVASRSGPSCLDTVGQTGRARSSGPIISHSYAVAKSLAVGGSTSPSLRGRLSPVIGSQALPFPDLYCMRKKPAKNLRSKEHEQEAKLEKKRLLRKKCQHKVERMYQLALANQIIASRLLENHAGNIAFDTIRGCGNPSDILRLYSPRAIPSPPVIPPLFEHAAPILQTRTLAGVLSSLGKISADESHEEMGERIDVEPSGCIDFKSTSMPFIPLSIEQLSEEYKTLDAKSRSSLWYNYTRDLEPDNSIRTQ